MLKLRALPNILTGLNLATNRIVDLTKRTHKILKRFQGRGVILGAVYFFSGSFLLRIIYSELY